jgi:hypothetical protein
VKAKLQVNIRESYESVSAGMNIDALEGVLSCIGPESKTGALCWKLIITLLNDKSGRVEFKRNRV